MFFNAAPLEYIVELHIRYNVAFICHDGKIVKVEKEEEDGELSRYTVCSIPNYDKVDGNSYVLSDSNVCGEQAFKTAETKAHTGSKGQA